MEFSKKAQLARSPKTQKEKRADKLKSYSDEKEKRFTSIFWCEVCQDDIATQCHHKEGRTGGLISDPENLVVTCTPCHDFIHANPSWAYKEGWLIHRNYVKS